MKLLVAFTILALLGVVYSQGCQANRHYSDSDESWDFTGYAAAEVRGAKSIFANGNEEAFSFVVKFCTNVNVLIGNVTNEKMSQKDWLGWSHGILDEFTYVGMEMHNPNTKSTENQVSPRIAKKSFEQDFQLGDHGYPCVTGRKSTLFVYCGQAGDTCANVPGVTNTNCLDGSTATSGQFCMCDAEYDPASACTANITLLMIDCPSVVISPNSQGPVASEPLSGGAVFGIIVLVLFLVTLVICAGGFAYNYKVNDLRGVDAVPFISVFRGSARDRPYQPASQSGYGSVAEEH